VRSHWLPERLARASHPAVVAAVGAAFALSFDTISHALVFSMTGASLAGWAFAAILGVVFTCGMALTDAASGLWVARLVRSADRRAAAASRIMSIAVAFLCLALAGLGAAKYPANLAPILSAASFVIVLGAYLAARYVRGPGAVLR
jgi:high-affinity nickel-transport protein